MKGVPAEFPYEGYRLYIVTHKTNKRRYAVLFNGRKDRLTITYAKYLMSVSIGRRLGRDEEVDHLDNDKTNDVISNLQVISGKENKQKLWESKKVWLTCYCCGKTFRRIPSRATKYGVLAKHYCSKACNRRPPRRA